MRVLVTGSRDWTDRVTIANALLDVRDHLDYTGRHEEASRMVLVHGAARGADAIAHEWAEQWGWDIEQHPADWGRYGKAAGPRRNEEMVDLGADICLAFPLPGSRGTRHCMRVAEEAGIPVRVYAPRAES